METFSGKYFVPRKTRSLNKIRAHTRRGLPIDDKTMYTHTETSNMHMFCASYHKTHDYLLNDLVKKKKRKDILPPYHQVKNRGR